MVIKLGSLFSGSGGFELAGLLSGIKPIWASEIEPFPIRVTTKRFPDMKHIGDVSKINGAQIEPVDVITFGSPCFVAGSLVATDRGYIPIEQVCTGDKVLTHTNSYQKVERLIVNETDRIYTLKIMGSPELKVTGNHPVYVREMKRIYPTYHTENGIRRGNERTFGEPQWKCVAELSETDYIGFAINNECCNLYELTAEECWLVGRYIADGYVNVSKRKDGDNSYNNKVIFCVGKNKYEVINKRLVQLCLMCGKGAGRKEIPYWFLSLPKELLQEMLNGYLSGAGSFVDNEWKATTISRNLAYSLQQAVAKVYGTYAKIYYTIRPEICVIEGRTVNQSNTYQLVFSTEHKKQDKYKLIDDMLWLQVKEIKSEQQNCLVYNLEVEKDRTYTISNFVVHNCQDLSVAGKRKGLKHDSIGDDETTRSGLFMEAIRIIKEMRLATNGIYPTYAIWENVPGAFSSNKGEDFRIVLEEFAKVADEGISIPRPPKDKWRNAGEIVGDKFSIAWRTFDAQYWGVPQRRKRIYLVADFRGQSASKVLFEQGRLPWHSTQSGKEGESLTRDFENCPRATDRESE